MALDEPNQHAATRFLLAALPELGSDMSGLRNVGLLATQELRAGVPDMAEWEAAVRRARPLLGLRSRPLVERLGFGVEVLSTNTSLLTINGRNSAIAVFCDEDEPFDAPAQRFDGTSPVSRGLAVADQHNVDWVVLTRAAEIRLYAARRDTGVGRKGRAETFVELNLSLLPTDLAGYLPLLFSAEALAAGGTTDQILERSADFASELAGRLRDRVYFETVPALAGAVAARLGYRPTEGDLDDAYEQVMVILFRLLFVAYAEDKDLLLYRTNSRYAEHTPVDEAELLAAAERYADALELLFTRTGSGKAQSTTLLVIADYDAVAGHLRDSRLADGTPLSADELMEPALEAEILPALFDTAGQPLWLGREQRDASTAQRIVLAARDRGCVGCGAPNSFCRPHHIQYWENDGPTDLDNLCLLCGDCHHKQVHTNGGHIVQGTDGRFGLERRRGDAVTTSRHVRNGAGQNTSSANVGSTVGYPLRR